MGCWMSLTAVLGVAGCDGADVGNDAEPEEAGTARDLSTSDETRVSPNTSSAHSAMSGDERSGSSNPGAGTSGESTKGVASDTASEGPRASDTSASHAPSPLPPTSCAAATDGGSTDVQAPTLSLTLYDRWHEAWLASPAVADLDQDGTNEIIVPRDDVVLIWSPQGDLVHEFEVPGRVWAPPVVGDLRADLPGLEFAVAAAGDVFMWDASGQPVAGFPVEWRNELRALAAADIDGAGDPELVVVTTSDLEAGNQTDILLALHSDGSIVDGFPPNTTGASGCDDACYVHAGFDQTLALGDLDADGVADILVPQDNAYVSLHAGDGRAFDAAPIFEDRTKFPGIRFMLDYAEAQQGWAEDESSSNQAHFTNTAPVIADVLGEGNKQLVMLSSVQNVSQDDRERGVALWVVNPDGTRPAAWTEPFHVPEFLDGLWDRGDNVVASTNQVTVVDLDPEVPGLEMVFAGFDGKIHAVSAANEQLWEREFTDVAGVLTGGLVAADLSGDGRPELVFNSYSTGVGAGELFVLGANGAMIHRLPLPDRGAMPVPTVADVDLDGQLEIVVSLKDAVDRERQVLVFTVPGSSTNCLPWPTGRANLMRTGHVTFE